MFTLTLMQNFARQYDASMSTLSVGENHAMRETGNILVESLLNEASALSQQISQAQHRLDCINKYIDQLYNTVIKMSYCFESMQSDNEAPHAKRFKSEENPQRFTKRVVTICAMLPHPVYRFIAQKSDNTLVEATTVTCEQIMSNPINYKYTIRFVYDDFTGCELYAVQIFNGGIYGRLEPHILSTIIGYTK